MTTPLPDDLRQEIIDILVQLDDLTTFDKVKEVFDNAEKLSYLARWLPNAKTNPDALVKGILDMLLHKQKTAQPSLITTFLEHVNMVIVKNELDLKSLELDGLIQKVDGWWATTAQNPLATIPFSTVFEWLLQLDFEDQFNPVADHAFNSPVSAFVVQAGPLVPEVPSTMSNIGERVLLRRLIEAGQGWSQAQRWVFPADPSWGKTDQFLCNQFKSKAKLPLDATDDAVHQMIFELLKTQTVLLVIDNAHQMMPRAAAGQAPVRPSPLKNWLTSFWQPLAQAANEHQLAAKNNNKLVLFLTDYEGALAQPDSDVQTTDNPAQDFPLHPLLLKKPDPISNAIVNRWLLLPRSDLDLRPPLAFLLNGATHVWAQQVFARVCTFYRATWDDDIITRIQIS